MVYEQTKASPCHNQMTEWYSSWLACEVVNCDPALYMEGGGAELVDAGLDAVREEGAELVDAELDAVSHCYLLHLGLKFAENKGKQASKSNNV